ncbi:FAD-dependent oxidoreductase [Tessaracoccus oleiagri]|uniref:Dihydrolipoamide dehydrogenase n=1 Tax=Tessaracoccus oleiagri TaxID=686624 RepID=A0A1G9KY85_9ACTN|nr:FAD-dependent oxidoreductase [Tessaracoccus oleiagri]SDL54662.1 dihydrolipoamide dehydrogenase [Tessaracoccus oleiagri]
MTDLAVLGAGSAGYAAALRASQLGLDVTLVDPGPLGGTCLHVGCIPTKAWLQSAKVRRTVLHAGAFGIGGGTGDVDAAAIRSHADDVVDQLHRGLSGLVSASGVRHVAAAGRLVGGTVVEAGGERIEAAAVLVATGAEPVTLGLPVDGERIITSEHALRLDALPRRAVVLGGGVIGVEFASLWADLGVEVVIVEALDRLLPSEEPALSKVLTRALRSRGVDVRTGAPVAGAEAGDGGVRVTVGHEQLEADLLLVAVGRRPRVAGLGLEEVGVELDGAAIATDADLRTSVPHIHAAGDVVAGPQLAHRGYAHGQFVAELVAWELGRSRHRPTLPPDHQIPRVTYSSPQVASVGLREDQAGPGARSVTYHLAGNGKSLIARPTDERETGMVKVVRSAQGPIVGVHAVGEDVAELITSGAMHVGWGAEPDDVVSIVHPHPTVGESLAEAILALGGRPLHMRVATDIG